MHESESKPIDFYYLLHNKATGIVTIGSLLGYRETPNYLLPLLGYESGKLRPSSASARIQEKILLSGIVMRRGKPKPL
jgi:hypothetical protein